MMRQRRAKKGKAIRIQETGRKERKERMLVGMLVAAEHRQKREPTRVKRTRTRTRKGMYLVSYRRQ
jgi:hypothetical protein